LPADSPSVEAFADDARNWLTEQGADAPPDYGAILPPDLRDAGCAWQRRLYDAGFAGIHWPVEYGGRGLSPAHTSAWVTECALQRVPPFINMVGVVLAGGSLLAFGTEAQKQTHLDAIIRAENVWCQLFSEPEAGSDLASLGCAAERDGDEFVVNGQKVWCSNGRIADRGILMARTDRDAPRHQGISFFVIDMTTPGIEVRPLRQITGDADFDEVFFTDARIPADSLLGPLGDGWNVGMATLTNERGYIGASGISLNRHLDELLADAGDLDAIGRQRLIALWVRGRALHAMGQRQGPVASILGSLSKLGTTELMFDLACFTAESAGADSLIDSPPTKQVLNALGARIAGGTSQVQRNVIGERILGLPREPRPTDLH